MSEPHDPCAYVKLGLTAKINSDINELDALVRALCKGSPGQKALSEAVNSFVAHEDKIQSTRQKLNRLETILAKYHQSMDEFAKASIAVGDAAFTSSVLIEGRIDTPTRKGKERDFGGGFEATPASPR
eukprot:Opistho-1_new@16163